MLCIHSSKLLMGQFITRGPYLQSASHNSIIIHWNTDLACKSKVIYKNSISNLIDSVVNNTIEVDHIVKITDAQPSTKYYYYILNNDSTVAQFQDSVFFITHPLFNDSLNARFWIIGDAGTGSNIQKGVRDGFLNYNNGKNINGWIWLGDNAYNLGLENEYQSNVFSAGTYQKMLRYMCVWAAPGNHDYGLNPANTNAFWKSIFNFPTNGECGGVASGKENYFSWDYGKIHFIQLDSYSEDRSANGNMAQWLRNDLQNASNALWKVAYFHHPPYSKGSHDSDNKNGADPELPLMRNGIIPILEENGVDLVLSGHSHCYERSYLINGHYDSSFTFNTQHMIDSGDGAYPLQCSYIKKNKGTNDGTMYVVCGVSGRTDGGINTNWPHPAMNKYMHSIPGSLILDFNESHLKLKFINNNAEVLDSISYIKTFNKNIINANFGDTINIVPKWKLPFYLNNSTELYNNYNYIVTSSNLFMLSDVTNCLKDTFLINTPLFDENINQALIEIYPNPINKSKKELLMVKWNKADKQVYITIKDLQNKLYLKQFVSTDKLSKGININYLNSGVYFLEIETNEGKITSKFVVQ